ncbi:MAG: alpha/beta hydrolase [Planctomycetota bacterium]
MIDPQARAFLDELKSLDVAPLHTLTPQQARAAASADAEALGPAEPLAEIRDRTVPGPDGEIPIRMYVPEGARPLPAFVFFHGGGWVLGSVDTHDNLCASIANAAGCLVVSVDYRLAPEHKYPASVDDAYAATQWVVENAERIGADGRRVAVGGDSAGGNLAAAVCLMARDRAAFELVLQVLIYPIVDFSFDTPSYRENADGYFLTRDTMRWFWQCYLRTDEDGRHPYASPLRANHFGNLPGALVITAEYDPLRDEGEAYAARLREAGAPVTLTRYDGMIHAFIRRPADFDKAQVAVRQVAAALKEAFQEDSPR